MLLLFMRHNQSYLCMQGIRRFFGVPHEGDHGMIDISHRGDDEAKQHFFLDHQENMRHPIRIAEFGMGQNLIHAS